MLHLRLTDRDIERVLAGHQPPGRTDLAEVAKLVAQIRVVSSAEQAPPMSPRLLAELDAAEAERRDDHHSRHHRRRAQTARRRWRFVGAAAVVLIAGGLALAGLGDAGRGSQTEIGDTGGSESTVAPSSSDQPAEAPATAATPATTGATPPSAPAPSASPRGTTATGLEPEADEPEGEHGGPPDGTDVRGDDNPWDDCFQDRPAYDCWLDVYEQAQDAQPPP